MDWLLPAENSEDFLSACWANLQTQPAVLGYALEQTRNDLPNLGYASVYPVATIAKIIIAQLELLASCPRVSDGHRRSKKIEQTLGPPDARIVKGLMLITSKPLLGGDMLLAGQQDSKSEKLKFYKWLIFL